MLKVTPKKPRRADPQNDDDGRAMGEWFRHNAQHNGVIPMERDLLTGRCAGCMMTEWRCVATVQYEGTA